VPISPSRRRTAPWPEEALLRNWVRALQEFAARFGYHAFPYLASTALAMQAAGLEAAGTPHLFSQDLREISPALNEDLLDLYGRSEQVLSNRFAIQNHTEALGAQFDWEFHPSPSWRRELHAFDYGFNLALTFRISREDRYAVHLRYLIAHWIAENPPGLSTGWELRPLARRIRNWILSADLARDAWDGDPGFLPVFQHSLALQCAYLERQADSAFSFEAALDCVRALFLAARFFRGPRAADLAAKGAGILRMVAGLDGHDAGGPSHLSPIAALRLAETLVEFLIFHPPADQHTEASHAGAARRTLQALEAALLPDGTLPLFGPAAISAPGQVADLFALGSVLQNEPAWKSVAGGFGIMPYMLLGEKGKAQFERLPSFFPRPESGAIPELGLYRLSGDSRSALIAVCAESGEPGAHEDYGSYALGLEGQRVVVDSGVYSPEGADDYFRSARAHNILLIDGEYGRPRADDSRGVRLLDPDRAGSPGFHLPISAWSSGDITSRRAFFCLEGRAWVVLDSVAGSGGHHLQNLIHFYPTFNPQVMEDCAVLRSRSASVTVIPLGAPQPAIRSSRGSNAEIPGLYSPDFGVKFAAATLALENPNSPLPWLGGYLIVPGANRDFSHGEVNPAEGLISFQLSGKQYRLRV
jgi:Heparinase II/III-like protein